MSKNHFYSFLPDGITFRSHAAMASRLIYAPLCGVDGFSLKSAITPFLSGDIKVDKASYLTRPASREDLRAPSRNFFISVAGKGDFSFHRSPGPEDGVEIGQLWHKVLRHAPAFGVVCEALSFVPVSGEKLELTRFTVRNISSAPVTFTPTAVVPVFGRALANKHDHEHVTALLKRTTQLPDGVLVEPTMLFNEEGHKTAAAVYYVFGCDAAGTCPSGTFPTVESFFGEGGTLAHPEAVTKGIQPRILSGAERHGKEAVGALRFRDVTLSPGKEASFIVAIGMAGSGHAAIADFRKFASGEKFDAALRENSAFWTGKTAAVTFATKDAAFSSWMRWVALQPVLRRIFGCSFLPDHDYGKGGKGWRDIWQDLLSLILIEPGDVRTQLLNNFGGVRIDGSNATIIGEKPGEFIADRNAITRVWMDHGVWPFTTTLLYINQSGDTDFLFETMSYFADPQWSRSLEKNAAWTPSRGNLLRERRSGGVYRGTVLEHILVQHLVQFFNVGEHNVTRLESADWNDGLDMAFQRGESVTFTAFYAGNLLAIADLVESVATIKGISTVRLAGELMLLLDTLQERALDYSDVAAKKKRLFQEYFKAVQPDVNGEVVEVPVAALCADLRKKGHWVFDAIRAREKVVVDGMTWFNGYYDNNAERVEGQKGDRVRMTLTGQVFPLMSGLATREETAEVIRAVEHFLHDKELGGYRLNTDFGVRTYLAMGRAFGFAFGTKENGAVFSHMAVMYGYALYKQGFAREGYLVLQSLYRMGQDPQRARIYPGVPEYFDGTGRGMYHFLTGSASWYVLTLLTMAYGVRGDKGDLVLMPQLIREEFDAQGQAGVVFQFAGKKVSLTYQNVSGKDAGDYHVARIFLNGTDTPCQRIGAGVCLKRAVIAAVPAMVELKVVLE